MPVPRPGGTPPSAVVDGRGWQTHRPITMFPGPGSSWRCASSPT